MFTFLKRLNKPHKSTQNLFPLAQKTTGLNAHDCPHKRELKHKEYVFIESGRKWGIEDRQ